MFDLALELVRDSPCDPKTLTRAAREHAEREPAFAEGAGLAALRWLSLASATRSRLSISGAPITRPSRRRRFSATRGDEGDHPNWVAAERPDGFVRQVLGRELGLS